LPEHSETLANDPFDGRRPTSHERMTGYSWDASYQYGPAPWDIGRPQPAMARIVSESGVAGAVLDAGCGTGEHGLLAASLGFLVLGVDVAETALAMAREKARERGLQAKFVVGDALHLEHLGREFETVLDCGLFHTFNTSEQREYVASLASVTKAGGTLYILCFSDEGTNIGPHPVRQEDLKAVFHAANGWEIVSIKVDRILTLFHGENGASAWFVTIKRI
jgi:SAM-dependent methyltransferase